MTHLHTVQNFYSTIPQKPLDPHSSVAWIELISPQRDPMGRFRKPDIPNSFPGRWRHHHLCIAPGWTTLCHGPEFARGHNGLPPISKTLDCIWKGLDGLWSCYLIHLKTHCMIPVVSLLQPAKTGPKIQTLEGPKPDADFCYCMRVHSSEMRIYIVSSPLKSQSWVP